MNIDTTRSSKVTTDTCHAVGVQTRPHRLSAISDLYSAPRLKNARLHDRKGAHPTDPPQHTTTNDTQDLDNPMQESSKPPALAPYKHIHPCRCDIPPKLLRYVEYLENKKKMMRETLERRLERVRRFLATNTQEKQLDIPFTRKKKFKSMFDLDDDEEDETKKKVDESWSIFVNEQRPQSARRMRVKVTKTSPAFSRKRASSKIKYKAYKTPTIPLTYRSSRGNAHRKRTHRSKNPKVLAIIEKFRARRGKPGTKPTAADGEDQPTKLDLNWRKAPIIPIIATRTSTLRKQINTYCGQPLKTNEDQLPPLPPRHTLKLSTEAGELAIQHTRSSLLRIQNAKEREQAFAKQQETVKDNRPTFQADYHHGKYQNTKQSSIT